MGMNAMDPQNAEDIFSAFKQYVDDHNNKSPYAHWTAYTLSSSNWNEGEYNLEIDYPHSTYDIQGVQLAENATDAQRDAFKQMDAGGYTTTNKIVAHGVVPEIDIPVMLGIVNKDAETESVSVPTYNSGSQTLIFGGGN